jgi:hypothetical protein
VDALNGVEDDPARYLAMYRFHVNLFAAPKQESFACTWEDTATALARLPRMIFELDGSFVLSGDVERAGRAGASPPPSETSTRWQVDGHLFDFAGWLHRLELHGECPPTAFDELLKCVGWPRQPLVFEMVREGETVDERVFRQRMAI